MGTIYGLCGPSGVGKTTFLEALRSRRPQSFQFLRRATSRPERPDEEVDFEYDFYSESTFLRKTFAGDLIFPEIFDGHLYGLDRLPILDALHSRDDAIVMAGVLGATRLRSMFPEHVEIVYMYTGPRARLLSPDALDEDFPPTKTLTERLRRKIAAGHLDAAPAGSDDRIRRRMRWNYVEISFANGEMRQSPTSFHVIENAEGKMDQALADFASLRSRTSKVETRRVAKRLVDVRLGS